MLELPQKGMVLNNKQITEVFGCQFEGGIRKSKKNHLLVLINDPSQTLYQNRWEKGCLYFTAIGKYGDQSLAKPWQNRDLAQANVNKQRVFLFEKLKPAHYRFQGEVQVGIPFTEIQPDASGQDRQVFVFPIRLKKETFEKNGLP